MNNEPTQKVIPRSIPGFVSFILKEIWRQKKWALLPLWLLLAAVALVLLLGGGSALLPAIYIAF